ncbi:histidine phosphatase family protein [Enemella sp. A6]|uniref:histidine phosphatase family protein n=1 Tax=Enemella sp. A6 TaxID=3440152 RepID=UPI003EBCA01B
MTARRLILWRHGQTDGNLHGRMQGQADVPLNDTGLAQARDAAPRVAALAPTRIVSSDLQRASQTAEVIAELTGLEVTTDARLQEINVGDWVGMTRDEVAAAHPGFFEDLAAGRDFRRSDAGETGDELGRRVSAALHELVEAGDDDEVLLAVGHGMAWRVGLAYFLGYDFTVSRTFAGLHNCGWIVLDRAGAHWKLEAYNVTADPREPYSSVMR